MRSMLRGFRLGVLALVCLSTAAWAAEKRAETKDIVDYPLPKFGVLSLEIPSSWSDETKEEKSGPYFTITFRPGYGKPFMIQVSPMWPVGANIPPQSSDHIRSKVEAMADKVRAKAPDVVGEVLDLKGDSGTGCYFSVNSTSPVVDEFLCMTQGMIPAGDVLLGFTILTNPGQEKVVEKAFLMLQGASHDMEAETEQAPNETVVNVPNQGWSIRFECPKLVEKKGDRQGRKFAFVGKSKRFFVVVVVDEAQEGTQDNDACLDYFWAHESQKPEIVRDSVKKEGGDGFSTVRYDVVSETKLGTTTQRHAMYCFVFEDAWVGVHCFVVNPTDDDEDIFSTFQDTLRYGRDE